MMHYSMSQENEYLYKGKEIFKNINKNLSGKYSQEPLDCAKQSAPNALKTASKRAIQKTVEVTGNLLQIKLIELQRSQELHYRIVQRQLEMKQKILDLIEKY